MATLTKSEIAAMSPQERVDLIDEIWCSFQNDPQSLPTPSWHLDVIQSRLAERERSSVPTHSWESVLVEMEENWLA